MAAMNSSMRILILSADVGGGHDAAARAVADEMAITYPGAVVRTENGLRLANRFLHRLVRDGYKLQITYASSTYALLFRLVSLRPVAQAIRIILGTLFGGAFCREVRRFSPDIVISTYPLVTALLAEGRRGGKIDARCIALVTDVDPGVLWLAPGIEAHLVVAPNDVHRARHSYPDLSVSVARPPIKRVFFDSLSPLRPPCLDVPDDRPVVLVSGGEWGVGRIDSVVQHLLAETDAFVIAACGSNEHLRQQLSSRYCHSRLRALPFWHDMPGLFSSCDLLIQTGAGVTCLEAMAFGLPVVLFNVLPGHGVRSASALSRDGMVRWARNPEDLSEAVGEYRKGSSLLRRAYKTRATISRLPSVGEALAGIAAVPTRVQRRPPIYSKTRMALAGVLLAVFATHVSLQQAYFDLARAARIVQGVGQHGKRPPSCRYHTHLRYDLDDQQWRGPIC